MLDVATAPVGGSALYFALMAGVAKPATCAGEGHELFALAIVAPNAGEALFKLAAVDELFHDLFHHGRSGPYLSSSL
jgi:hypothetical protein